MNSTPSLQTLACAWADQQPLAAEPALQALQNTARQQLHAMRFPDRKTEAWKYTGLHTLANASLWHRGTDSGFIPPDNAINVDATLRLRIVNGLPHVEGDTTSSELQLQRFGDLDAAQLQHYLPLCALEEQWRTHPFAQLCEASLSQGWLLVIKAGQRLQKPIVIEQWSTANDTGLTTSTRVLVVVEAGADATLLHITDNLSDGAATLQNGLLQIHVKDNARLQHIQLQVADEQCHQMHATQTTLYRDSRYQHYIITLGAALIRNDLHLRFIAPGAEAMLNGAFLSKHSQHVDNHLNLEHISGRCQSTTRYKGLITDRSRAVFNGRIHIHPDAQKTDAQLSNKNLLLSREAEIDTKPELEIYADDVKCAHGASVGQLDEKALFYFESRGIDKATAEAMLSYGFINEIIETLPLEGLSTALTPRLTAYFRDVKQLGGLWQA